MNKQKLVENVTAATGQPKAVVVQVLDAVLEEIQRSLESGGDVTIMDFGTFLCGHRKAGKGFNPHTGGSLDLPALKLPKFRAGKGFKQRLNGKG